VIAKRANGEGSVYRRRKDGRWVGSVTIGWVAGKQRRKVVTGKTRAEASRRLVELQARLQTGLPAPNEQITVGAWLDRWLKEATPDLAYKTAISYEQVVEHYLRPEIGTVRLNQLNPARVQRMLRDLAARGVRPPSVKYALDVLRIALRAAQMADLIQRENPARVVKAPTYRRRKAAPFTATEAQAFMASVRQDPLHALIVLAMTAALRRGELLGLRWGDVALERRQIHLARQLQRQKGKGLVPVAVKTERSEAPVVLTALAVRALQAHRARVKETRLAAGPAWKGSDDPAAPGAYVFVSELGTPLDPDNTYRHFQELVETAGLPAHRMHDMRHTTATLLHALGVPAVVARDLLRQTDIRTTLGVYTHADAAAQLKAADELDELLGGLV
jgi:integrase